jgi:putative Mg2+ transporter-C (MgtC) family protein
MFSEYEIYFQLVIAVILGSLLGFERYLAHKTAGMRTFALVTMGSTVFTIMSQINISDPTRIAAQVVTGIGFLGAGLIIFRGDSNNRERVHGLTTAAGLWVAAAIGMAIGFRLYIISIVATALALIIFTVFWFIEHRFPRKGGSA